MPTRRLFALLSLAAMTACSSRHPIAEPEQASAPATEPVPSTAAPAPKAPSTFSYNDALEAKQNAVETELRYLDLSDFPLNHWVREWAGIYYSGDGISIRIAPHTGVVYTMHGCMGLYDSAYGDIVESFPGGVRIALKTPDKTSYFDYMSDTIYFVRWGDLRFLVPETQLQKMVDNFNEGGFARSGMYNIPRKLGAQVDHTFNDKCPPGMPELPPPYTGKLIDHVIQLNVIHTSEAFGESEKSYTDVANFRVRLDAGTEQGVFTDLFVQESVDGVVRMLVIDAVEKTTCSGTLSLYADPKSVPKSPLGMSFTYHGGKPAQTK